MSEARRQLSWGQPLFESEYMGRDPRQSEIRTFIRENPGAVHLFQGIRGRHKYIRAAKSDKNAVILAMAERPNRHGPGLRGRALDAASRLLHRAIIGASSRYMDLFLAMAARGVAEYKALGMHEEKLVPFMYVTWAKPPKEQVTTQENRAPKCLYVGRIDYKDKGLDLLLEAFKMLPHDGFKLDIVGTCGPAVGDTAYAVSRDSRLRLLGGWPFLEVVERMSQYDLCVVPSRYDGWNTIVNQAINSGVPVLVSDQATSDELVTASGAGVVLPVQDISVLAKTILELGSDRDRLLSFKRSALGFRERISVEAAAQYFCEIADFSQGNLGRCAPTAPWAPEPS